MNTNFKTASGSVTSVLAVAAALIVPANSSLAANCVSPPSGLVSWWRAESNTVDTVGANNGTLVGNTTYGSGRVGQAFVFDGNGDAVSLGNPASLHLQTFTIEAWVQRSSSSKVTLDASGEAVLFGFGTGGYGLALDSTGHPALAQIQVWGITAPNVAITDTNFHHVAVTRSGSTVTFYVDGVADLGSAYDPTFTFNTPAAVGAQGDTFGYGFLGNIDELGVYSRALSSAEIQAIYNAGSAGKCTPTPPPTCAAPPSGLVSWWKAESNAVDTIGSNNGTLVGNTTYSSGQVGQDFVLDGNGDAVSLGNPASLHLQTLTIEGWVKRANSSSVTLDPSGAAVIFGYGSGGYALALDSAGHPDFAQLDAGNIIVSTVAITDTNFHHYAVTRTGSTVIFYVDGVAYPGPAYNPTFTFSTSAAIGARGDNLGNSFLGSIDEVSIYSRALSPAEIQAIYTAGSAGKCTPTPPPTCVAPPSGLVSWWRGESNTVDTVSTNNGTLLGNTTYGTGRVGQAFAFDGNGDGVSVGNPASLQLQTLTIEAWVQRASSSIVSFDPSGAASIFAYGAGGYGLQLDSAGHPNFSQIQVWGVTTTSVAITDTNFHHIAVTRSGSSVVFYVDGVAYPGDPYDPTFTFNSSAAIGAQGNALGYSFLGKIDELGIYNRALSGTEIQAIYNAGSAGKCTPTPPSTCVAPPPGLVSWWKAESNTVDIISANNGTLAGSTTYAPGQAGQAFAFDGNGDGVSVGNPASLQLQTLTIEAWVRRASSSIVTSDPIGTAAIFAYGAGGYALELNSAGHPMFSQVDVWGITATSVAITDTNFHHLAVSRSGSAVVFYVDGTAYPGDPYNPTFTFTTSAAIGAHGGTMTLSFLGNIDEVSVYSRALSSTEIQAIYNAGSAGKCTSTPPPTCVAPPSGLVSWWRAESNTVDTISANNGTLAGNTTYSSGQVGQDFVLDGNGDAVSLGNPASLHLQTLTIEGWVKRANSSSVTLDPSGAAVIFGYGSGGYALALDSAGHPDFAQLDAGNIIVSTVAITDTNFHHYAVTRTGSTVIFYVDGVAYPGPAYNPTFTFSTSAAIGARGDNLGNSFLGSIDEVSVYSRALSPTEIQAIYTAGSAGKCSGLSPAITQPPGTQTVPVGSSALFTVSATGSSPLNYQWSFAGTNISDATTSSLILTNVQMNQSGSYTVVISNLYGLITNSSALLTVTSASPCTPAPAGLIGWWRAEGNAADTITGTTASLAGGVSFAPGEVGLAFNFDGTGEVSVPSTPALNVQTFTLEAWVNPSLVDSDVDTILNKENTSVHLASDTSYEIGIRGPASPGSGTIPVGHLAFFLGGISGLPHDYSGWVDGGGAAPLSQWTHCALAFDGTSVRVYTNGALARSITGLSGAISSTTGPFKIGSRAASVVSSNPSVRFNGLIDEVSIYNRALSGTEIQAIYSAGNAGKCTTNPPSVFLQPTNQTVVEGGLASFSVTAAGNAPLAYQWSHNTTNISGATASSLTLTNVQMSQAGAYAVVITNAYGKATSSNAMLTVTLPPAVVQVANVTNAPSGVIVEVPIVLLANGNENALGFSLSFDPSRLTFSDVVLGNGSPANPPLVNASGVATGRLGIAVGMTSGATFPAVTQEVVRVLFTTAVVTNTTPTTITFGDQPTVRQLSDAHAGILPATYVAGTVSIAPALFEGDVSPRPNGDEAVTVTDWVLVGLYAARLDYPTNASEFQRADCAPRTTFGDGQITVSDWVQAGRYAVGLDPLVVAGGPTNEALLPPVLVKGPAGKGPSLRDVQVSAGVAIQGQPASASVALVAQGDENGVGFSLAFDPTALTFTSASLGSAATGASFLVNSNTVGTGHLGFVLRLPPGKSFPAGTDEVVRVNFRAAPAALGALPLSLTDVPVIRDVADTNAFPVTTSYLNGSLLVNPPPSLTVTHATTQGITLSWPVWATNFVVQGADTLPPTLGWSNVPVTILVTNDQSIVILPVGPGTQFYRLYHP